jgi:integrator complex subunit 8
MSTLYSIRDTSCNTEVTSEYRQLWPSSLAHMNSISLNLLHDILNLLIQQCMNVDPYNAAWLRTTGDIYFSQALFIDSLKFYLKLIICETKYFFQQSQIQRVLNEKLVRNMMRSCFQLNKFTHVACLSQYLPVIDYATAFKCFQEEFCLDNMDDMFICIWDVALIEYLIFINSKRAYFDKRNLCMNICALHEINESNPKETKDKNIEFKRILLFLKLIKYYFF